MSNEPVEILVLRGLPASGKTTHAMSLSATHTRVSRDDIRMALTGRTDKFVGEYKFEEQVTKVQEAQVRALISVKRSVVIDDTNLKAKHARRWIDLANSLGVESDVINFKVPLDELLKRNERRFNSVPEQVIRDLYVRFPYKQWTPILPTVMEEHASRQYTPNPSLPPCITVDLDGTLARMVGRGPYDTSRYAEDVVNEGLADLLAFLDHQVVIGIFTGRSEEFREVCEQWLEDNGIRYDFLLMRPTTPEGHRPEKDSKVKQDIFLRDIAPKYNHLIHFDDRNRVVEGLRSIGVQVAQVIDPKDGDF